MSEEAIREGSVRQNPLDCEIGDGLEDKIWGPFMHESKVAPGIWAATLFDPADPADKLRKTHGHLFFEKQSKSGKGAGLLTLWARIDESGWSGGDGKQAYAEPSESPQA